VDPPDEEPAVAGPLEVPESLVVVVEPSFPEPFVAAVVLLELPSAAAAFGLEPPERLSVR
jgi:hypothetical protein